MLTRKEIENSYRVNKAGLISSPGKFEGEPVFVPYFWEMYLNGFADDDGEILTFEVDEEDRAEFPELADIAYVYLSTDENGFVYSDIATIARVDDES